jgi:hypothetical protein
MKPPPEPAAEIDPAIYLGHVAAVVRDSEYVPVTDTDEQPTWRAALERLACNADLEPAVLRRAHQILGWAASLKPRDADSYRARMAACLAQERLTVRDLPLAASAVRAFNRHLYHEIRGRRSGKQLETRAQPRR